MNIPAAAAKSQELAYSVLPVKEQIKFKIWTWSRRPVSKFLLAVHRTTKYNKVFSNIYFNIQYFSVETQVNMADHNIS